MCLLQRDYRLFHTTHYYLLIPPLTRSYLASFRIRSCRFCYPNRRRRLCRLDTFRCTRLWSGNDVKALEWPVDRKFLFLDGTSIYKGDSLLKFYINLMASIALASSTVAKAPDEDLMNLNFEFMLMARLTTNYYN